MPPILIGKCKGRDRTAVQSWLANPDNVQRFQRRIDEINAELARARYALGELPETTNNTTSRCETVKL